jgi:hypothetical protein
MDPLVNVDGIFSGHHLVDGRTALLLATFLRRSHSARPKMERHLTVNNDEELLNLSV